MSDELNELDLELIEEALQPTFSGMEDMINEIAIRQSVPLLIAEVKRLRRQVNTLSKDLYLWKDTVATYGQEPFEPPYIVEEE